MKTTAYKRMKHETRTKLEALYNAGLPVKQIAQELSTSEVTIYRELKRGCYMKLNSDYTEAKRYSADRAQAIADFEQRGKGAQPKIGNDYKFVKFVEKMILKHKYSPAAILLYIKQHNLIFKTKVCRATLYNYIDKGIFSRVSAKNLLRQGKMKKKHRTPRPKTAPRGRSIETRPTEVATRNVFGHWEFDTVIGSKTKGETLLCFTERKTRFEIIFKAKDKSAASTVTVFNKLEKAFGRDFHKVFKSMTCDNGTEFSDTAALERSIYRRRSPRTTVYYCHPYTSSERGSNENQNAFIRRFIPKGTSMKHYTDEQIRAIQDYINAYPRALLNGKNSQELFENELANLGIKNFFKNFYDITY